MGYKMKGFGGFGNSPAKQKKEKHFLLRDKEGPVANYITLSGNGREVELGSFLSEDERKELFSDLNRLLNKLNRNT